MGVPGCDPTLELCGSLIIPPDPARLREIREYMRGFAAAAGFDDDRTYDIALAASEAAANAILHGARACEVRLVCTQTATALELSIESSGPFTVRTAPAVSTNGGLGFGIPLMLVLADRVLFANHDDVVRVVLTFLRPSC